MSWVAGCSYGDMVLCECLMNITPLRHPIPLHTFSVSDLRASVSTEVFGDAPIKHRTEPLSMISPAQPVSW